MKSDNRAILAAFSASLAIGIAALCHGLARTGNPSRYFGEGRWTTGVSCFALLLTAFFAARILGVRWNAADGARWIWALIASGFVFLAIDEGFQLHEKMDTVLQSSLNIPGGGLADRIDDAIIGAYGLIGLGALWLFRAEILAFRVMLKPLAIGAVIATISIACDALSNRSDIFFWATGDMALSQKLEGWFAMIEGATMLMAEAMFAVALYLAWRSAAGVDDGSRQHVPKPLPR